VQTCALPISADVISSNVSSSAPISSAAFACSHHSLGGMRSVLADLIIESRKSRQSNTSSTSLKGFLCCVSVCIYFLLRDADEGEVQDGPASVRLQSLRVLKPDREGLGRDAVNQRFTGDNFIRGEAESAKAGSVEKNTSEGLVIGDHVDAFKTDGPAATSIGPGVGDDVLLPRR